MLTSFNAASCRFLLHSTSIKWGCNDRLTFENCPGNIQEFVWGNIGEMFHGEGGWGVDPRAVAVSHYGWLKTSYCRLAG